MSWKSWVPEELHEQVARVATPRPLTTLLQKSITSKTEVELVDVRDVIQLEERRTSGPTGARSPRPLRTRLTDALHGAVDRDISIRSVLQDGRDLHPEDVLRLRALYKGVQLLPELVWEGPESKIEPLLAQIDNTQEALLHDNTQKRRFALRLLGIELEHLLIAYVATELVDPQILDPRLSLDLLCHADQDMSSNVILKLGLARAYRDEIEASPGKSKAHGDSSIRRIWHVEAANAREITGRWAEQAIKKGRAEIAGPPISVRA